MSPATVPAVKGAAPLDPDEPMMSIEAPATPRPRSQPKTKASAAWAAWQAQESPTSGTEFLDIVASWTDGTTAQLTRAAWPAGVERPTSAEVRERLCHHIGVAARGERSSYLDALEKARNDVIDELRGPKRRGKK
ncbi:MAG: hypothetical protein ACR2LQ_06630 [Acidimicrobiales bacterium]